MSDIQYKSTKSNTYKVEENSCSDSNWVKDWSEGAMAEFNAKYKAWEIRRGFTTEETQGNYFKRSNSRMFENKKTALTLNPKRGNLSPVKKQAKRA